MDHPRRHRVVFILWMAGPLIWLALAAGDFPLVRNQADATESWATVLVLLAQVLLASVLWADLLASVPAFAVTLASALPSLAFAGVLTGEGYATTLVAASISLLWLGGLFLWRLTLPQSWRPWAGGMLLLWLLGGLALAYVHAEFNLPPGARLFAPSTWATPFLACLKLLKVPSDWQAWLAMAMPLVSGAAMGTLWWCRRVGARPGH